MQKAGSFIYKPNSIQFCTPETTVPDAILSRCPYSREGLVGRRLRCVTSIFFDMVAHVNKTKENIRKPDMRRLT